MHDIIRGAGDSTNETDEHTLLVKMESFRRKTPRRSVEMLVAGVLLSGRASMTHDALAYVSIASHQLTARS